MKHTTINRRSTRTLFTFGLVVMLGVATFAQSGPGSGLASADGSSGPTGWAMCDGTNCTGTNTSCDGPLSYETKTYYPHSVCTFSIYPATCDNSHELVCTRTLHYTAGYCSGYINTTETKAWCCGA